MTDTAPQQQLQCASNQPNEVNSGNTREKVIKALKDISKPIANANLVFRVVELGSYVGTTLKAKFFTTATAPTKKEEATTKEEFTFEEEYFDDQMF